MCVYVFEHFFRLANFALALAITMADIVNCNKSSIITHTAGIDAAGSFTNVQ